MGKPDEANTWTVPRWYPGETVVVLGGGPSLNDVDHDLWRGRYPTIATNAGFRLGGNVLFFQDGDFWHRHADEVRAGFAGTVVSTAPQVHREAGVKFVLRLRQRHQFISDDPRYLPKTTNSGQAAMALAYLFGASRIVLLGFDGRANGNWYPDNPRPAEEGTFSRRFRPSVEKAYTALVERGVEVVNATPGSAFDVPVMTPEAALC